MSFGINYQGVNVNPLHCFGVNAELKNNCHLYEDQKLVYSAGNNVIVDGFDEQK